MDIEEKCLLSQDKRDRRRFKYEQKKWTDMKQYEEVILRLVSEGRTQKSIAEELGLEPKQIKNFMYCYRIGKKRTEPPKKKGRPPSVAPHTEKGYQEQILPLEMENELLCPFLHDIGRM